MPSQVDVQISIRARTFRFHVAVALLWLSMTLHHLAMKICSALVRVEIPKGGSHGH